MNGEELYNMRETQVQQNTCIGDGEFSSIWILSDGREVEFIISNGQRYGEEAGTINSYYIRN